MFWGYIIRYIEFLQMGRDYNIHEAIKSHKKKPVSGFTIYWCFWCAKKLHFWKQVRNNKLRMLASLRNFPPQSWWPRNITLSKVKIQFLYNQYILFDFRILFPLSILIVRGWSYPHIEGVKKFTTRRPYIW